MITFLPVKEFNLSAGYLDRQRLGKQRLEAKDILLHLVGPKISRWTHHPVMKMWKGHELELCLYGIAVCKQWIARGYVDNQLYWFEDTFCRLLKEWAISPDNPIKLAVFSDELYASHRAALLWKDPKWYGQFGWKDKPMVKYVWK